MTDSAAQIAQIALLGEAVEYVQGAAVFVWDDDRNYVAANDAACALVGLSRAELLALKVGVMTADRAAPYFEQVQHGAVHTAAAHTGSLHVERADGPVEIDWLTCRTTIAGLPYMVSICWRKGSR